jgi:hypothetical protein
VVNIDYFKKKNAKKYTAWDLNCKRFVKKDTKLARKINRETRHILKKELEKETCGSRDD